VIAIGALDSSHSRCAEDDSTAQRVFAVSWNIYPSYLREDNPFAREKRLVAELERLFAALQARHTTHTT
jgi:hypothetical protein